MGLKTTNYEIKSMGITLPEAYAIIKKWTDDIVFEGEQL